MHNSDERTEAELEDEYRRAILDLPQVLDIKINNTQTGYDAIAVFDGVRRVVGAGPTKVAALHNCLTSTRISINIHGG